jgi:hypothetical protein
MGPYSGLGFLAHAKLRGAHEVLQERKGILRVFDSLTIDDDLT